MLDQNLVLKGNELFLVGEISTEHTDESATGLYARDTRHLSRFRITINGVRLKQLSVRTESAAAATVISSNPLLQLSNGDSLTPMRLMLEQRVSISNELVASFSIHNYTALRLPLRFAIEIAADFRDLFDIRGFPRMERGQLLPPIVSAKGVVLAYRGLDGKTAETVVRFDRDVHFTAIEREATPPLKPSVRLESLPETTAPHELPASLGVQASFEIGIDPGMSWSVTASVSVRTADGIPLEAVRESQGHQTSIKTDFDPLNRVLERSLLDLDALQTTFPHGDVPAAGIPWFVAPFGRDSLIVGLQTLYLKPERAAGTLRVLAAMQGSTFDPEREEEPGKILHEMRYGEMARLHEVPHSPYYGTVDATPLFAWLFAETVAWTGDKALYDELMPNAERAIEWIEQHGDLDGDGFVEYRNDGEGGARIANQVWKDSYDSLSHVDGRPVVSPVAGVEVHGYVFAAYDRLAEVTRVFGEPGRAAELRAKAGEMRQRIEDAFWMPDVQTYAQALDGAKQHVRSISSNPGHLLMTGLPDADRAALMIARMGEPDLSSGWGIRTLAAGSISYNPMSYHNGSVWPHDNSVIGSGFYRYGEADAGNQVTKALLDAALSDRWGRLPELYCGFARIGYGDESPVGYPVSCSPQAWAAGAIPLLLKSMLGLEVDLEGRCLQVNPMLPDWLSVITLRDISVLGGRGSLKVTRTVQGYQVTSDDLPLKVSLLP